MRHLLPRLSEGVPAEGVLGRALQLRHRLHARARWEYLFFTQRQERQSQDRAAVQLRVAGESRSLDDGSFLVLVVSQTTCSNPG